MPKNTVSDPITDQEMAFAHLIMSGTMTDRRAAEAVGLNPETAAYTKSKPRVRAYMIEHRAAVRERLVDQEADGMRKLNLGRDQILARLWELANLSHEVTRGIIAGQIKALTMIVAIEGLIPSGMNARRLSPSSAQPAASPVEAKFYKAEWRRKQQHQAAGEEPGDAVAATEAQPAVPQVPDLEPAPNPAPKQATDAPPPPPDRNYDRNFDRNQPSPADPLVPHALNRVPLAEDSGFAALLETISSPRQPFSVRKGPFARRR
jgi:hypothetical protein